MPDGAASEPLTRALTRAVRAVTGRVERELKAEGLSLDQWLVVEALAGQHGLAMIDLAARTMTTGPTLTRVVDRLVSNATVYREVDQHDRRKIRVYLSPRGTATYRRTAARIDEVESELLAHTGDGAATLALLAALTRGAGAGAGGAAGTGGGGTGSVNGTGGMHGTGGAGGRDGAREAGRVRDGDPV